MSRILYVINTLSRAGAEVSLMATLNSLKDEGHEIDLFVLMNEGEMVNELPSHVNLLNRRMNTSSVLTKEGKAYMRKYCLLSGISHMSAIRNLPGIVSNAFSMYKKGDIKPDKLLWRVLSDGAPRINRHYDRAVAFLEGGSTYYVADHVSADKKEAYVHVDYNMAGYSRALDTGAYDAFDNIYAVSDEVRESFLVTYPEHAAKTSVMPNIIDYAGIRRKADQPGGFTDDYEGLRILTVARLHHQKGVDIAIKAARILMDRGLDFRWYVLGDGEERKVVRELIEVNGLADRFILAGAVDNPYPYMKQCDVYVQPSRFEGKSVALKEALYLNERVIATDVRGNREYGRSAGDGLMGDRYVGDGCAELCKPTPKDIARAIENILAS